MHAGPVTCLCLSDDQLILSGSSLGSITISGQLSDQRVAKLRSTDSTGLFFSTLGGMILDMTMDLCVLICTLYNDALNFLF